MNNQSNLNHEKIKHLLNRSATKLEQPVLARLSHARKQAMMRFDAHQASPAFAWAGIVGWNAGSTHHKARYLAAAVLLLAVLSGAIAYCNQVADTDTSDVDIEILTDDLPMHVYID